MTALLSTAGRAAAARLCHRPRQRAGGAAADGLRPGGAAAKGGGVCRHAGAVVTGANAAGAVVTCRARDGLPIGLVIVAARAFRQGLAGSQLPKEVAFAGMPERS